MKKIQIKGYLSNQCIEFTEVNYQLQGYYDSKNKVITYTEDDELKSNVEIIIFDSIINIARENNEYRSELVFSLENETSGKYFVKELHTNLDITIYTDEMIINDGYLFIKYYLDINGQSNGVYEVALTFKEV